MMDVAISATKEFMLENTREKDLLFFAEKSGLEYLPDSKEELDFRIVAPAFLISEFTKTFWVGILMYSTFVAIDILAGGNNIIPILINTDATIKSIATNVEYIKIPTYF